MSPKTIDTDVDTRKPNKVKKIDRQILGIALPAIITNITVPLLGLIDTAIVGHMGAAAYIGAVAVGAMIFNLVYWVFGFLRMGTSGLTAQAYGAGNTAEATRLLVRSLYVAIGVAAVMIVLQRPLCMLMLAVIQPSAEVMPLARQYFNIVVWGAPASLALFSLTGWFIGMQNTRLPMTVSIMQNIVNIVASLVLVYALGWKIEGVAAGTVIAQYGGLLVALLLLRSRFSTLPFHWAVPTIGELRPFLSVNRDIFVRTLFLVGVNLFFTAAGARQGATILAVNALLMQLYLLFSYFTDGFAYAGEALCGRYLGAGDRVTLRRVIGRLFVWGAGVTTLFTLLYIYGGTPVLHMLTNDHLVATAARDYLPWACLVPLAGIAAFVWDGVFIGITATGGMLLATSVAAACFFAATFCLMPAYANHGLWAAMLIFLFMRGCAQTVYFYFKKL